VALSLGLVQGPGPQTPSACLKAVQEYPAKKAQEADSAGQKADFAAIQKAQQAMARESAAQFTVDATSVPELRPLAQLYAQAGQLDMAGRALDRGLQSPGVGVADRAALLVAGVDIFMRRSGDGGPVQAERYATMLDGLDARANIQKAQAHARLGSYYRGVDTDAQIVAHYGAFLDRLARLPEPDRAPFLNSALSAYASLAEVYGGRGDNERAIATLKQGLAALPGVRNAQQYLGETLQRYQLVGQPAGAIEAAAWLNAPPGTATLPLKGRVRIVEFTAHWCGPCRKSYPAMRALHADYSAKGADVVFVTRVYGYVGTRRNLTPDQEVEADREYFLGEHQVAHAIAIDTVTPAAGSAQSPNDTRYHVSGIPQIVVVDKRGIVRRILIGWDPANEAPLRQFVEKLLAEPATAG